MPILILENAMFPMTNNDNKIFFLVINSKAAHRVDVSALIPDDNLREVATPNTPKEVPYACQ
jgi:hypothetical protein